MEYTFIMMKKMAYFTCITCVLAFMSFVSPHTLIGKSKSDSETGAGVGSGVETEVIAGSIAGELQIDKFKYRAKIIERVVCLEDSSQSFALYLPEDYTPDKKWPVLLMFDPRGIGSIPLKAFKPAAEKYQFILVGSNNVRNGPWERILNDMKILWRDIQSRFSINRKRIYTTGFSGGGRAAAAFPHVVRAPVEGIISCGAGLPSQLKPEQVKPAVYYGIVGLEDFNYKEMIKLDQLMENAMVTHFIEIIDGDHRWPPAETCTAAFEYLEISAIKRGLKEGDSVLINEVYSNFMEKVKRLNESGNMYFAVKNSKAYALLFQGLKEKEEAGASFNEMLGQLSQKKQYKKFVKEETKRNKKELQYIGQFISVFSSIEGGQKSLRGLPNIIRGLQLKSLLKIARKDGQVYESAMAKRLLAELSIKGYRKGMENMAKTTDYERAVIFLEIASRSSDKNYVAYYNLACAYSLNGKKKKALENLKLSVEKGFRDIEHIQNDPQLDLIKKEEEFKKIISSIQNL
jgi:tetratricopeptide (TPR) repeat protein